MLSYRRYGEKRRKSYDYSKKLPLLVEDAFTKCDSVLQKYDNIMLSYSGGADSDVMLDMVWRLGYLPKCKVVFFDTGIEYKATKEHLTAVEEKYNITMQRC